MPPKPVFKRFFAEKPEGQQSSNDTAKVPSVEALASALMPVLQNAPSIISFDSRLSAHNLSVDTSERSNGGWIGVKGKQKRAVNAMGSSSKGQHSKSLSF
jgi:hypothetical protein